MGAVATIGSVWAPIPARGGRGALLTSSTVSLLLFDCATDSGVVSSRVVVVGGEAWCDEVGCAAIIRAGFVYVISNMGAFGINMVKIGMTRRLVPMDRVRELGDASVPFRFDVHALFFADDAVTVENTLHQAFTDHRVTKVNPRREFF
jgi:hypothetical protein